MANGSQGGLGGQAGGFRLGLVAVGAVALGVLGWLGTKYVLTDHQTAHADASLSYWVQSPDDVEAVKLAIQASGATPVQAADRTHADLVITSASTGGSTGILAGSVGQPATLSSGKIVAASTGPTAYAQVGSHASDPGAVRAVIGRLAKSNTTGSSWTMDVVGDIGFGRSVYTSMLARHNFLYPFAAFRDELRSADLSLANLECALSDTRAVVSQTGMTFVAPFQAAAGLSDAGIDAVSVANNHSFNGGAAGYTDTLAELKRQSIAAVGGGANDAEAHAPRIITVKGQKVALLAYSAITGSQSAGETTPGMAYISMAPWGPLSETDVARMESDIKAARSKADLVFVYYHWGTEYTHDANADQRTVAHRAIDAGADVILGAHPHWVQGVEWYHDHLIAYSLGNFIFDQNWATETRQGTMLKVSFQGDKLQAAQLVPYTLSDDHVPQPASADAARQILGDVSAHSWWPSVNP